MPSATSSAVPAADPAAAAVASSAPGSARAYPDPLPARSAPPTGVPAGIRPAPVAVTAPTAPPCAAHRVDQSPTAVRRSAHPDAPARTLIIILAKRTYPRLVPRAGGGTRSLPATAPGDRCPECWSHLQQ